jgi:hypothetical protein
MHYGKISLMCGHWKGQRKVSLLEKCPIYRVHHEDVNREGRVSIIEVFQRKYARTCYICQVQFANIKIWFSYWWRTSLMSISHIPILVVATWVTPMAVPPSIPCKYKHEQYIVIFQFMQFIQRNTKETSRVKITTSGQKWLFFTRAIQIHTKFANFDHRAIFSSFYNNSQPTLNYSF